jgi:lysophospholipase L1-like esterase
MQRSKISLRLLAAFAFTLLLTGTGTSVVQAHTRAYNPDRLVGPKQYYLALGNSLAFGYQPNLDFEHGYVDDLSADLRTRGNKQTANLACPEETSATFINGGCPYSLLRKFPYQGNQLSAALLYLNEHQGQVSPVTLDIGANDVLPDLSNTTCAVDTEKFKRDLAALDTNLAQVILPRLHASLTVNGAVTGDLLVENYYDPYQNQCPNTVPLMQEMNSHIAADVQDFGTLVDVFGAFGGAATPNQNICVYTWICNKSFHDVHSTRTGYRVIAEAFEQSAGY